MRKILTKENKSRKIKKNQLFMGLILIFLMIFSTLGFAFVNNTKSQSVNDKEEYNGIEFQLNNGLWYFSVQSVDFITRYNPNELGDIMFSSFNTMQNYNNKPLYLIGESGEHFTEIDRNLRGRFVLRIGEACLEGEECEDELPVKDCSENLIVFRIAENEKERIYRDENCVFIVSSYANQVRYADVFLFDILDI